MWKGMVMEMEVEMGQGIRGVPLCIDGATAVGIGHSTIFLCAFCTSCGR